MNGSLSLSFTKTDDVVVVVVDDDDDDDDDNPFMLLDPAQRKALTQDFAAFSRSLEDIDDVMIYDICMLTLAILF